MTEQHSITSALADFAAAPMSRKAAMLLALLVDREIDALFDRSGADDRLVFRAALADRSPPLALVMELAALRDEVRLVLEPVEVPIADYPSLSEAQYMVSLYNSATVPRVLIAEGEQRHDAMGVLRAAVAALEAEH